MKAPILPLNLELCCGDNFFTESLGRFICLCTTQVRSCLDQFTFVCWDGKRYAVRRRVRIGQGDPSADRIAR